MISSLTHILQLLNIFQLLYFPYFSLHAYLMSMRLGEETLKYRCVYRLSAEKFNIVITLFGEICPKNQNCQFKLKFAT